MSHHHRRAAAVSAPDPFFSNTVLLLNGDGTNGGQNNTFVDSSTNNFTVTRFGNTTQGSFTPFTGAGGSGYFDNTGDYLTLSAGSSVDFGSGDFTIEGWVYPVGTQGSYDGIVTRSASGAPRFTVGFGSGGTTLECWCDGIGGKMAASTTNVVNSWHHFAFVRSGTLFSLYVDGVAGSTTTTTSSALGTSTDPVYIGTDAQSTGRTMNGYISSLRILKGTAQYTSNFTPPAAPLTAITNTSLLFNFTNASIIDNTSKNNLETVGNAQISTSVKKFGTGSMKFDGTGDYLLWNGGNLFAFGTSNFTIECWLQINNTTGTQVIYDGRPQSVNGAQPILFLSSGSIRYQTSGVLRITGATLSTGQWYHVAVCRSGTSTKLFLDGTQTGSTFTDTTNYVNGANRPVIGADAGTSFTNGLNGYLDDFRVSKVARYTANFTPPYRQLPTR